MGAAAGQEAEGPLVPYASLSRDVLSTRRYIGGPSSGHIRCGDNSSFSDFITSSAVVDDYLLSMTSIHLKRAGLNALGYTKDRYFFYALYLAIGNAFTGPPTLRETERANRNRRGHAQGHRGDPGVPVGPTTKWW